MTQSESVSWPWRARHFLLTSLRARLLKPAEPRLPRHGRAEQPLLYLEQVQRVYDLAQMWGACAVCCEKDMQDNSVSGAVAAEDFQQARTAQHVLRSNLTKIFEDNGLLESHRYLIEAVWQQAHYWVQWRVRSARTTVYGDCRNAVERAEWSFKEYLLTLDHEAVEPGVKQE